MDSTQAITNSEDGRTNDLPGEWSLVLLSKVATLSKKPRDLDPSSYEEIAFVPMDLIPDAQLYLQTWDIRSASEVKSGVYFTEGDLLLAKITPCLENGKQGIARGIPNGWGFATTEVFPIHATDIDSEFLAFYLNLPSVRRFLASRMEGSTGRQRLPRSVIENLSISLPEIEEQRAIAGVLRAVQQSKEVSEKVITGTRELKRSLLRRLFTRGTVVLGEEANVQFVETEIGSIPADWQTVRLDNVARVGSGGTPDRSRPEYWGGAIPWIKTGEINYRVITRAGEHITELGLRLSAARIVKRGTILMAMYGQGVTRGRVAILGMDAAINQACAAIEASDQINPHFLYHWLTYQYEEIRALAHGANQKNLNAGMIKQLKIPLPPDEEQQRIAQALDVVDRKLWAELERRQALTQVFESLLDELMAGKLRVAAEEATHA